MKVHSIKTDNANLSHKVYLRRLATKDLPELRVLDCFAGENRIWSNFDCKKYYGIEKVKGKGVNLNTDNERVLQSLDLSKFNVIDCDSYGIPVTVLFNIFENPTLKKGTVIIYTCIGNSMSALPKKLLQSFGLQKMYKKMHSLFNAKGHEFFYGFLYKYGVRKVWEYTEGSKSFNKTCGFFVL